MGYNKKPPVVVDIGVPKAEFDAHLAENTQKFSEVDAQALDIINKSNFFFKKINSGNSSAMQFSQFKTALTAGTINVTVIGDSISTDGPNALTFTDCYWAKLKEFLTYKYPDKTFVFTNRAIGGTTIQQWQSQQTFNSVTKAWIDHVKDTNPDLLIIGWGMNNSSYATSKQFKFNLKSVLDYIVANFTKQPSIALVTTPRPVQQGIYYETDEAQNSRDIAAFSARSYGYERGCYVIDINRIFNIKRNGTDVKEFNTKAIAVNDTDITPLTLGTFSKNGVEYTLQNSGQYLALNPLLKNFKLSFDIKFTSVPVGDENITLTFNQGTIPNTIMIMPNRASGLNIKSYANNPDSAELGTIQTALYADAGNWNDSVYRTVLIQKQADLLEIFVNGISVLRDKIQINNVADIIKFSKGVGSTGIATLQNIKLYDCEERSYIPSITDEQMFGVFVSVDDASTKLPYGGNSINHPSSIGLEEVYVPPLKEFVNDLPNA